jgi:hypothetical protein
MRYCRKAFLTATVISMICWRSCGNCAFMSSWLKKTRYSLS